MGKTPPRINLYIDVEETNELSMWSHPQKGKCTRRRMSETHISTEDQNEPRLYEIRIKGHLDGKWAAWFGGLTITLEDNGDSLLTGRVVDQAGLYGLLKKVRDLGMPLHSVNRIKAGQADASKVKPSGPIP
jgi:hypothetical protein